MKKFFLLLRDFKKVSFWAHSHWAKHYRVFHFTPAIGFEWDTQCYPIAEDGIIVFEGSREFTIFIDWLWFMGGMCFEFGWTVKNPADFEPKPMSEEEVEAIACEIDKAIN